MPTVWSSGCADMFDDGRAFAESVLCPCLFMAHLSRNVFMESGCNALECVRASFGSLCCCAGLALFSFKLRHDALRSFGIKESPCADATTAVCCCVCSNAQISRQLSYYHLHNGTLCVPKSASPADMEEFVRTRGLLPEGQRPKDAVAAAAPGTNYGVIDIPSGGAAVASVGISAAAPPPLPRAMGGYEQEPLLPAEHEEPVAPRPQGTHFRAA